MQRCFKSHVLPSCPLKDTNDIDKVSAMLEAPLGRLKQQKRPTSVQKDLMKVDKKN